MARCHMSFTRRWLVEAYYAATYPYRAFAMRRWCRRGQAPINIVLYHRIDDDWANLWTTSRGEFARQIDWLSRHYEMISFAEARRRVSNGYNERPAVHVTFDDGYSVNCEFAIPLLVTREVPCTYFVCVDYVFDGTSFPHDVENGPRFAPNTIEQLRAMADAGIEIGAHSATHADLGRIRNRAALDREVVQSTVRLQAALGRKVRYFAFPFGQRDCLNVDAMQMAYDAGIEAVVSAYGGFNRPGGDAFHLTRMPVDGPLIRLKNWVTGDPRRRYRPYPYKLKVNVAAREGALVS